MEATMTLTAETMTPAQFNEINNAIVATVKRMEKRKAQADDAIQATWERLLTGALATFDPARGTLSAFGATVARSTVLNLWDKVSEKVEVTDDIPDHAAPEADTSPEYAAQVRRHFEALEAAVAALDSEDAMLFNMMTAGASYEDAAQALGIKVGTVKVRWHRLKEELTEEVVE